MIKMLNLKSIDEIASNFNPGAIIKKKRRFVSAVVMLIYPMEVS